MKTNVLKCKTIRLSIVFFFSLISMSVLYAQGEKRQVEGFNVISYSLPGTLDITQGSTESLVINADPDDLQKIVTKVENNELKIYTKNHGSDLGDITISVTVKELNSLSVAGSGDVIFKSELKTTDFEISLSGSGNITCMQLSSTDVEIHLAGSGDIHMGGTSGGRIEIHIAGSGDVNAEQLETREGEVNISGSGSTRVWATDELEANIVGSGDIYYKGNPRVNTSIAGSGRVESM